MSAPGDGLGLQVSPIPTSFDVTVQTLSDGKEWVLLACKTALGIQVYCLPGEVSQSLGELLSQQGYAAKMGLIVPKTNGHQQPPPTP